MVLLIDFHVHFSLPLSKRADSKRDISRKLWGVGWGGGLKYLLAPLLRRACVLLLNMTTVLFLNTENITKSDRFLNTKNMLLSNTKNALFLNTENELLSNTKNVLFWKKKNVLLSNTIYVLLPNTKNMLCHSYYKYEKSIYVLKAKIW